MDKNKLQSDNSESDSLESDDLYSYFELIGKILEFPSSEIFYVVSIIQRKKDFPENSIDTLKIKCNEHCREHFIRHYFVRSYEELMKLKPSIIDICQKYNARAYFSLDAKNIRKVLVEQMKEDLSLLSQSKFDGHEILKYRRLFDSVPRMEVSSESSLRCIHVDLDVKDSTLAQKLSSILEDSFGNFYSLETPNGYHFYRRIRTRSQNNKNVNLMELGNILASFRGENKLSESDLEMKKNSMILLYFKNLDGIDRTNGIDRTKEFKEVENEDN